MIIRKPYAFLMKHFRKIHILLLFLSIYIFYKTNTFYSFVKQYMSTGVYNPLVQSVKTYASDFFYLMMIIVFIILGAIVVLLKKKKKPIIDYIVVIGEYLFVFIVFIVSARYFNNLDDTIIDQAGVRAIRDLLLICSIPQYVVFIWEIIRILGIDLNRFGFKEDEEFKEISEEDREEVEVAVEVDKDVYKRQLKKRIRFLKYYYKENTFFLNIVFSILAVIIIFMIARAVALGDKTYSEKRSFKANGYTITINDSYVSKYGNTGKVIEKNSSFVIIDVTVVNNLESREMDIEKFLLVSNKNKYVPTLKMNNEFKDIGTGYVKKDLKRGVKYNFILIYKVDNESLNKKTWGNKFVIYYQNIKDRFSYNYIKVKLDPTEYLTKITNEEISLNNELNINDKKIKIINYEIGNNYNYLHKKCEVEGCFIASSTISSNDKKIMKLDIESNDFNGYSFIDFLSTYGKIIYRVDKENKSEKITNPITTQYNGNSSYFFVNSEIEKADLIKLEIDIRNNKYIYILKGENNEE